jgi:DNA replication protein DnaC
LPCACRDVTPSPKNLYEVINKRCERSSILPTSSRAPEEWPELFGSPLLASAGLDRLAHRAHMVVIIGTSFRACEAKELVKEVSIE